MALHHQVVPTELDEVRINDYLYLMQQQNKTPSESCFKFTVYGLRYAFRIKGLKDKYIALPSIKGDKRLPIVLSREEVKSLLKAPKLLKHRVLIGLLYGGGLRCFEVRNLRLNDSDFDRKTVFVRKGKGDKSRYIPLSDMLIRGLRRTSKRSGLKNGFFVASSRWKVVPVVVLTAVIRKKAYSGR